MLKVARELLGESQDSLAIALKLTKQAIQRAESNSLSLERQQLLTEYFESHGLRFVPPDVSQGWSVVETKSSGERSEPARLFAAARIGLDQSQGALGIKSGLSRSTIARIEDASPSVQPETRRYLIDYLIAQGVHFLAPHASTGWGVMFAFMTDAPTARHPRQNVLKRKQASSAGD